jgi:two-component system, OmpR family, phosphate regulon sensor histidine kinase PhoR
MRSVQALLTARFVLGGAFAVLGLLFAFGALSFEYAVAGAATLAVIAGIAVLTAARDEGRSAAVTADASGPADAERAVEALIASLPDAVIVLDADARVVAFNAPARALAPALAHGASGSLALRVPEIVAAIRAVAGRRVPLRVEYSQRVPVDRWFAVDVIPLAADALPAAGGMLLAFHDLTPLHRVEEMRADFVANASHELRAPLAALSGFIDTLQGPAREDAAARERFLAIMKQQAARMARLIDDLLSLSRVELNEHVHPDTPVDVAAIVRQVVDGLQMLARERGVDIAVEAAAEPVVVAGDRDELTRVFENLIENALKYGAAGKRVDIGFARAETADGPQALIAVRDYGPGIAAEHRPRLTERFYRIDVGQSRAEGGTGLGLALVKHILNRHRGRLAIESEVGKGAVFTAQIPLVHSKTG